MPSQVVKSRDGPSVNEKFRYSESRRHIQSTFHMDIEQENKLEAVTQSMCKVIVSSTIIVSDGQWDHQAQTIGTGALRAHWDFGRYLCFNS